MLLLIASFVALAGLYVLLDAPFVAVIQIIVYAGAIMVLFLFVVMLLNAPQEDADAGWRIARVRRAAAFGALLAVVFARRARLGARRSARRPSAPRPRAARRSVARDRPMLFTDTRSRSR